MKGCKLPTTIITRGQIGGADYNNFKWPARSLDLARYVFFVVREGFKLRIHSNPPRTPQYSIRVDIAIIPDAMLIDTNNTINYWLTQFVENKGLGVSPTFFCTPVKLQFLQILGYLVKYAPARFRLGGYNWGISKQILTLNFKIKFLKSHYPSSMNTGKSKTNLKLQ